MQALRDQMKSKNIEGAGEGGSSANMAREEGEDEEGGAAATAADSSALALVSATIQTCEAAAVGAFYW